MPAAVDQSVLVDAFVRWGKLKGRPAVLCIYEEALADTLAGVQVTSVTFEGASGSGMANEVSTAKLLTICEQALQIIDGDFESGRATHVLFGATILET